MKLGHLNDPTASELALARANYETWFQNKISASMRQTSTLVSHEQVMYEVEAIIYQAELKNIRVKPATPPL